jgi:hypothetical protein
MTLSQELQALVETGRISDWLEEPEVWQTLHIDDERPFVDRLWIETPDLEMGRRLFLHRIHAMPPVLEPGIPRPLYHPHRWPAAVFVVEGKVYSMEIGTRDRVLMTIAAGTAPLAYTMNDPEGWHSVHPAQAASYSIMLVGDPWPGQAERTVQRALGPLGGHEKKTLIEWWTAKMRKFRGLGMLAKSYG